MELTSILMDVQSVLRNASKTIGDFTKIRYKGGNEMKIAQLVKDLKSFLTNKNYYSNHKINQEFYSELKDITLFLILNTEYKTDITNCFLENAHLINVCSPLSKCLLANIITELDLIQCFCDILPQINLEISAEILHEIQACLKKTPADVSLDYVYLCLKEIVIKLDTTPCETINDKDVADNLIQISAEILSVMRFFSDELQSWRKLKIYQHMGHTAQKLLMLLEMLDIQNEYHSRLLTSISGTTIEVFKAVTINVFCTWAETDFDGRPLQTIVAEQAYGVVQKFKDVEEAKELIQILSSMAKKPKTLAEQIQEADVNTMVAQINKADENQSKWFTALINTQVFNEPKAIECLETWSHLCTVDDIGRLLSLASQMKSQEINELIMRCLNHLLCKDIVLIMMRFHSQKNFTVKLETNNFQEKLVVLLNKIVGGEMDIRRELLILCLQNPPFVLEQVYGECIKSSSFTKCASTFFEDTKNLVKLDQLMIKLLKNIIKSTKFDEKSYANCKELLTVLIAQEILDRQVLLNKIVLPQMIELNGKKNFEALKYVLMINKDFCNISCNDTAEVLNLLLKILDENRQKFFEFTNIRKDINEVIVNHLRTFAKKLEEFGEGFDSKDGLKAEKFLNTPYVGAIEQKIPVSLYNYILPKLNVDDHADCATKFLKILPSCVTEEWVDIFSQLCEQMGAVDCFDILTDVMILLCQFAVTQEKTYVRDYITPGLQYCLQNYGIILKDFIYQQCPTQESKVTVTKKVLQLLYKLPESVKDSEGLKLVSIFSVETLQSMKNDKQFAALLLAINNTKLTKYLAMRVLS